MVEARAPPLGDGAGDCLVAAEALYSGAITPIQLLFRAAQHRASSRAYCDSRRLGARSLARSLVRAALTLGAIVIPWPIMAIQATAPAAMVGTAQGRPVSVSAVRVTTGPAGPLISIAADGPLPSPTVGVLENPARIYLDLPGVTPRAFKTTAADDLITAVRVALHSAAPPVTRIVIDLDRPVSHSVDLSRRLSGEIVVSLHAAAEAHLSRPAPPARVPWPSSSALVVTKRPGGDVRQYMDRMSPLLQRLEALRPVLESIDRRSAISGERVEAAAAEIERLREGFASLHPPRTLVLAHDLLGKVCALASRALSLARMSKDGVVPWDAASAAAGALILLSRARTELPDS
jgi:AMIN domain